jgi:hypothetical protein
VSAYAVNKVCRRVVHEPEFRDALQAEPERVLRDVQPPLSGDEISALVSGDVGRLSLMGAHDFQLYHLQRFQMLGITLESYIHSMKSAHGRTPAAETAS